MINIELSNELTLHIADTTLRGFVGADTISIISDYLTDKGANYIVDSDDERAIEMVQIAKELATEKDPKKIEALQKQSKELELKNYKFFIELQKKSKLDFKSLFNLINCIFNYYKVDEVYRNPDLYTLFDLLTILELVIKNPKNNLYSFLDLITNQKGAVA
jgi:hypothetical protein